MSKILVLFAHPMLEKSRVQKALLDAARSVPSASVRDLYEEYPDYDIDVHQEQALLSAHDIIVLQHPFYWYSCPPLMKQWIDLVLEHGWAYGRHGKALVGKKMLNAISAGGGSDAYRPSGLSRHAIREFLLPFEQTALLCNMEYLPPFVVHGTHRASTSDIARQAELYAALLTGLGQDTLDLTLARSAEYLTDLLPDAPTGKA
jgi:glutathione-regulated potassium-efflux system ancillary protein KefG